jgi:hypothetical protein
MSPLFSATSWSRRAALGLVCTTVAACFWTAWHGSGQMEPRCTWENVVIV